MGDFEKKKKNAVHFCSEIVDLMALQKLQEVNQIFKMVFSIG